MTMLNSNLGAFFLNAHQGLEDSLELMLQKQF